MGAPVFSVRQDTPTSPSAINGVGFLFVCLLCLFVYRCCNGRMSQKTALFEELLHVNVRAALCTVAPNWGAPVLPRRASKQTDTSH